MLNKEVFEKVQKHGKKILIVTKYWDSETTKNILREAQKNYSDIVFWLWENRTKILQEKNLERKFINFIGNVQSREIKNIAQNCSTIHSLSSIKHAKKIEDIWIPVEVFLQIKLDPNKDNWVSEEEIWEFLKACKDFKYLKIIGISGIWAAELDDSSRRKEFRKLIHIRDIYIPHWFISAGTSRDYEIALEEWIDIIRVGQKAVILSPWVRQ